jgi:hypothetical protein
MDIGFCDKCGIQLNKYHRIRIVLDGGDWDNSFEFCDDCYNQWQKANREYLEAVWNPNPRLLQELKK